MTCKECLKETKQRIEGLCCECAEKAGVIKAPACRHKNAIPIDPVEYEFTSPISRITTFNRIRRYECLDCGKILVNTVDRDAAEHGQFVDGWYGTTRYDFRGGEIDESEDAEEVFKERKVHDKWEV